MSFTTLTKPQTQFLEGYLRGTGRTMSAAQAESTFGILNLSARMSDMRSAGLKVRKQTNTQGRTSYAISRRDVLGYQGKFFV
jgi:hypothetical protein